MFRRDFGHLSYHALTFSPCYHYGLPLNAELPLATTLPLEWIDVRMEGVDQVSQKHDSHGQRHRSLCACCACAYIATFSDAVSMSRTAGGLKGTNGLSPVMMPGTPTPRSPDIARPQQSSHVMHLCCQDSSNTASVNDHSVYLWIDLSTWSLMCCVERVWCPAGALLRRRALVSMMATAQPSPSSSSRR